MIERISLLTGALLLVVSATPAAAEEKRLVKEQRADGSLVLDESGLTQNFQKMLSMMQSRTEIETGSGSVVVMGPRIPQVGVDWQAAQELLQEGGTGQLALQTSPPFKLRTEAELAFENGRVGPGNVSADFAGLYSLWLERTGPDTWNLVFNEQADVWGTMHDPAFDVARAPLEYRQVESASKMLQTEVDPVSADGSHTLRITWGEHSWSTSFRPVSTD